MSYLNSDAGTVEGVAVELLEDLVDLGPAGIGVDVNEAVVLDDVGLQNRSELLEELSKLIRGRAFGEVADEKLLRRPLGTSRLALLDLDVPAFDDRAVEAVQGRHRRPLALHVHEAAGNPFDIRILNTRGQQ